MRQLKTYLSALSIFVCIAGFIFFILNTDNRYLITVIQEHRIMGAVFFSFVMFVTTVIAPLTSLPLVPVVAPFLGPFTTGVASFAGWFAGALVAFFLGRTYGKPFLARYMSLDSLSKYESYVKPEMEFFTIVVLRMLLPVDVLSYLLGVLSHVSYRVYASATAVGIVWFSFALAYLGNAVADHHYVLLASISVASVVVLYGALWYLRKPKQK